MCDHSNTLAVLDYIGGYSSGYQASRLWVDKCILCVVLHMLTSVLFNRCLHTPIQSRTLSPFLYTLDTNPMVLLACVERSAVYHENAQITRVFLPMISADTVKKFYTAALH